MTSVVSWFMFILVQSIFYNSAQSCNTTFSTNDWFGANCQYKCHCKKDAACDITDGDCPGGCDTGWFGPACQYADIAPNGTIRVANDDSQNMKEITDGDDTTCASLTGSNISLDVNWDYEIYFTWLRIIVRNIELQKESLSIKFPDDVTSECSNVFVDYVTMDIYCNITKPIKEILLNGAAVGTLCSLYISKGRNVALNQSTNQTSLFENRVSGKAVDGGYTWDSNSCTHTDGSGEDAPTWSLHFDTIVSVTGYTIFNRMGDMGGGRCCLDRLKGFILRSFTRSDKTVQHYTDNKSSAFDVYNVLSTNPLEQVSTVQITATHNVEFYPYKRILTLCEVEIYGDSVCSYNTYGRNCTNFCKCAIPGEKCFVSTGNCPSGCKAGFYGQGCTQPCEAGYFGVDCRNRCNSSCSSQQCEEVDGNCTSCDLKGKKLPSCTEDCDPGFYESNCKSNCSRNCLNVGRICDIDDGKCLACKEAGFYGPYCNISCSSNCKDLVCDIKTGYCEKCKSGFYGFFCINTCSNFCNESKCEINSGNCTNCNSGFYGANCTTPCPTNCKDSVCDINYGICISCRVGFNGSRCVEAVTSDTLGNGYDTQKTVIGAVVGSVCGLVALLIIGTVFFFWRRHKSSDRRSGRQNTNVDSPIIEAASQDHANSSPKKENKEDTTKSVKPKVPHKPTALTVEHKNTPEEKGTGYYNTVTLQPVTSSTVITLSNLQSYLLTHSKEYLHEQFKNLPLNTEATMMVGLSAENKNKNRYKNICAYDHSRVHLEADSTKKHGDYINASYLKGYKEEEKFIASQGPNKIILNDFIRMIWEQKVEKVVMLTNLVEDGKSKCDPYWPDEGETTFGEVRVRMAATQVFADYIIRRLQLYMDSQPMHPVTQFHFTSWPDKGVPENPWALVDFEQRVAVTATKRPIVVHCSAGVGRTGTFIALRNVMREAEDTQQMDFLTTVAKLRQDRTMMIQTAEQYVFLHEAAKVAMTCINTTITSNNITDRVRKLEKRSISGKTEMEIEFDAVCSVCLEESQFTDEEGSAGIMYQNSKTVSNKLKNRFGNILPKENYRPLLMCESSDMGDYINAVLTPSFRKRNQDIITQLPLPTTVVDFWRLITQMKISLVVAFEEELQAIDSTIGEYLPASEKEKAIFPPFQVCMGTWHQGSDWEERKLIIYGSQGAEEHSLIHLRYTQNATDPKKLLSFLKHARTSNPEQEARMLYMCRNGATFSGLACVLTLLLDRMDNDQRLTVPLVVGAIKTIRPQVIPTVEQYKILYQVIQKYNETNSVYYNFNDPKLSVPSNDDGKDNLGNVGSTEYANAKF